ncbi:MAG TPA: 4Fe-4S dicluster domain-containing protein [Candidatus Binataceae bacterium]|nr:4Fe-4S dicluster domain-containing protein [Candidatus Binataceae bacterium]
MNEPLSMPKAVLDDLIALLRGEGLKVLGPVANDGGVTFAEVRAVSDMAVGMRESQEPGRYRLSAGVAGEIFGVVNGAGSLKPFFFAPEEPLLEVQRERRGFQVRETIPQAPRLAFIGVRACDLAAIAIQDRIFLHDSFRDTHYEARRKDAFMVAVNCTRCAPTCFCVSMKTGPEATAGFDLSLTEMEDGFVVRSNSPAGDAIVAKLRLSAAPDDQIAAAQARIGQRAASMQRRLDTSDMPGLLYEEAENPRWNDVAARCLSCTNCTMVCPTCFCNTVIDVQEIDGNMSRRVRKWDSCFSLEHAHIRGINFRPKIHDRYRQWLTHKLASWIDQFGTSGCVGCGRCITWCPVGIDLTEEVAAIRAQRGKR